MTLPKPERVRAFKPKTKTGCLTCKKRRVKCDEARPECNRCTKLGIECGYKIERSATHGPRDHPRLLPKHAAPVHRLPLQAQAQAQAQAWAWTVVRSPGEPHSEIFKSQPDYAYFCFFREQSTHILAGPYRDNLWERIVLQACHEEPSIRALAASIGALDLSTRGTSSDGGSTTSRGSIPSNPLPPATGHRVYALDQYGRALAAVRKLADSGTPHPGATRHALIAAIIIYCFECIYEGPETAVAHFEKALYFLGVELARHGRPYIHLTTSSPTPDLEGELVAAFVRLDSGLLGRPASYQSARLQRLLVTCDFSDLTLPPAFSSLNEARNHLEQAEFYCMPQVVNSWADAMTPEGLELSEETLAVARETSIRIAQWMAAFAPILARAHKSRAYGGPFIGEYSLQIHALLSNLAAQAVWARAQDAHEYEALARDLNADSYAINDLARAIADEPGFKKTFVWDNCILQGLITVIVAAPDRAARTQALDLINSIKPRREGAWDSDALSKTGEVVLGMSEDLNPFGKVHLNRLYVFTGVRNVAREEQQKSVERAVPTERSPDEWDPEVNSTGNPKVMGFGQVLADWACRI